jgi:hypothetical protein
MTLRFAESCDNGSDMAGRGWGTTFALGFTTNAGKTGGGAFSYTGGDGSALFYRTVSMGTALARCAMWMKWGGTPGSDKPFIRWTNAAATQFGGVGIATTGVLKVYPWNTSWASALATGTINVCDGGWHYVESECYFADASGSLKVWVDGTLDINFSGDTLTTGTVSQDRIYFGDGVGNAYKDDILIWDDSGSDLTGNLGGKAYLMKVLRPTSDASVQFTRSTGATNWSLVDEATLATSDYVEDGTSGHIDRYGFADTGLTTEAVKAVVVEAVAANPGAGSISCKILSELSGTTDESASISVPAVTSVLQAAFVTKPGGGAWAMTNVDSATFGIKVA